MTLSWVESQLEDALNGSNTAKNVYDAAALIIVRDEMRAAASAQLVAQSAADIQEESRRRDAVVLTAHSADLDTIPTLEQAEKVLASVVVNTPEERDRVNRAKTWTEIIKKA